MEIGGNGQALLEGKDSEPISYEWMVMISKAKYQGNRDYQLFELWDS